MKALLKKIPYFGNRNILIYYLFCIVHASYFAEGNWIFLYLLYFNYAAIGLVDSIAFGIGLLLEIPTGAIADLIGRRTAVRLSFLIVSLGILTQGFASSPVMLFIGNVLFFIGLAFYSGSMEALTYDTLIELKKEKDYDRIVATSKSLQSISYVIAVLIGGFAATINVRYPFLLWGVMHAIAFVLTFALKEPKIDTVKVSLFSYLDHNRAGIKELLRPKLKPYLFFMFMILGIIFWYDWGFIKPAVAVNYGFDSIGMGIIFAIEGIFIAMLMPLLPKIRKHVNDYTGLVILNFFTIFCVFLFGNNIGIWGALPIIVIAVVGNFAYAWISIIINREVDSSKRATALSTVATILKVPYVITAYISGQIIEAGFLSQFLLATALVIGIISFINLLKNYRQILIK